ncbi:unnamed protein product [Rangifer tarandus platyrhynchus]|uniref:Uncharacterized protein n=2 Tax=Rangifer tarandus platyrhynchus TaxID=3082113 RepID=A0ACB0FC82_RANTA|nr:unnamed protein product [Rangifer tarandus platyrhynchus]CAI9710695.1 unnamed protein product [Rangifer tarandus platyrhynchus]
MYTREAGKGLRGLREPGLKFGKAKEVGIALRATERGQFPPAPTRTPGAGWVGSRAPGASPPLQLRFRPQPRAEVGAGGKRREWREAQACGAYGVVRAGFGEELKSATHFLGR